jgi:hypothetical protein
MIDEICTFKKKRERERKKCIYHVRLMILPMANESIRMGD